MDLRTPNAVMMEESSVDEVGANKVRQGAFEHVSCGSPTAGHEGPAPGADSAAQAGASAMEAKSLALRLASTWAGRCDRPECPC
eukprot:8074251-Pyramimonas_sp.AAC.1